MIPLNDEENKSYEKQKVCYIYEKEFNTNYYYCYYYYYYCYYYYKKYDKARGHHTVITLENLEESLMIFVI